MFTGSITIREATAEDIPFLQAMIWEAVLASPTYLAQRGLETIRQAEERYWRQWAEHPDPAFVALDGTGQKLGAITAKPNNTDEPVRSWRIGIAVKAEARSQGVGQRLIERTLAFARAGGAGYVSLFVDPLNTRALALYQRLGFVVVGDRGEALEMRINLR